MKLDLACGARCAEGFEGVDCAPLYGVKWEIDLLRLPWPLMSASVEEIRCSHFIEHIPLRSVEARDIAGTGWSEEARPNPASTLIGKDMLFSFFDECYRILKPGGKMTVICPCGRSNRAFQDPTHRRFIVEETFQYLNKEWRVNNGLGHYRVYCDFEVSVDMAGEEAMLPLFHAKKHEGGEVLREFLAGWNVVHDLVATMVKR